MAGEKTRDVVNEISVIPLGVTASGTLSQTQAGGKILAGTGTNFLVDLNVPRPFLWFPNTTPPQLLEVKDYTFKDKAYQPGNPNATAGIDQVWLVEAPAVAITGQSFEVVSAMLREIGLLNKGDGDARFDGAIGGSTGTTLPQGQTEQFKLVSQTQNSVNERKDAHWVDATGTIVEVYEQP